MKEKWKQPPVIKIYEALGAVADERVEVSGNSAKVFSSSRNKSYDVKYDPESRSIMTNDNGSYWQGYLGYPAIAFLLKIEALEYRENDAALLQGILWKDLNQRFKNDFDKTLEHIQETLSPSERNDLLQYVRELDRKIADLNLSFLGKRKLPPKGY